MKWKSCVILPNLCLLLTTTSASAKILPSFGSKTEIKQNQSSLFTLKVPSNWERIDDPDQLPNKVKLLYIGKGQSQFTPSINLACEESEISLDEYVELAKNFHVSQAETFCNHLGKIDTASGQAQLLQIDRKTGWGELRFLQASIIVEGIAYVITATATRDEFVSLYPLFYQAIQSFQVKS